MTPALHIDYETRSAADLRKTGVYVYAEDATTDVWCAAFAVDDEPVGLWHPDLDDRDVRHAIRHSGSLVAHNAAFERQIWRRIMVPRYGWPDFDDDQWRCTMAQAYAMALPGSLDEAAGAVGLDIGKDMAGKRLMMQMARPRRAEVIYAEETCELCDGYGVRDAETCEACGGRGKVSAPTAQHRYTWWDDEDRKQRLYAYCKQDVEVERQLDKRLYRLSPTEQRLWLLDQQINDRGVHVDVEFCEAAKHVAATTTKRLDAEMRAATAGEVQRCSNAAALVEWTKSQGVETASVDKSNLDELLKREDLPDHVRRALLLRQEAAKSSVAKIDALLRGTNADDRARGLLQFHAATTGRWGGRRFQPQNLPRPTIIGNDDDDVAETLQEGAIRCIKTRRAELVDGLVGPPLSVVSDCIRGAVVARPGHVLNVADFSNIEGRVLAWLAGEFKKLDAFRAYDAGTGPDLYKVAAADIYHVGASDVTKDQRQIGKVSELACGYAGGVGAFQTMAVTYRVKVPDDKAAEIVKAWRAANLNIVQFWGDLEDAGVRALDTPGRSVETGPVRFVARGPMLALQLPSSRVLTYPHAKLVDMLWVEHAETGKKHTLPADQARVARGVKVSGEPFPAVSYMGVDSRTKKWQRQYTYGGKWAENITQAVARDVMRDAMFRVEAAGYAVGLTVHDEILGECPASHGSFDEFKALVAELPAWAKGLPVAADGWRGARYRK